MNNEKGQGLVEFAVVLAIVFLAILIVLVAFGPSMNTIYGNMLIDI